MNEVTVRTPNLLETLKAGSASAPSAGRRWSLMERVIQGALLRRWFARHFRSAPRPIYQKSRLYPGA